MLDAVMTGHRGFQPVIDAIIKLAEKAAKEPRDLVVVDKSDVETAVRHIAEAELREAAPTLLRMTLNTFRQVEARPRRRRLSPP